MSAFLDSITLKTPAYNERPIRTVSTYESLADGESDAIRAILYRLDRDRVRTFTEPARKSYAEPFNRSAKRVKSVLRDGHGPIDATTAERKRGAFGPTD